MNRTTATCALLSVAAFVLPAAAQVALPAVVTYFEAEAMTLGKGFRANQSPYGYSGNAYVLKYGKQTDFTDFHGAYELPDELAPGCYAVFIRFYVNPDPIDSIALRIELAGAQAVMKLPSGADPGRAGAGRGRRRLLRCVRQSPEAGARGRRRVCDLRRAGGVLRHGLSGVTAAQHIRLATCRGDLTDEAALLYEPYPYLEELVVTVEPVKEKVKVR